MFIMLIDAVSRMQDRDETKRQLTAHQKMIEKHKEMIQKCINFTKMLLVEKVSHSCCVLQSLLINLVLCSTASVGKLTTICL